MKPTLFKIPDEVFGIPIFGVGLLLGIVVLAAIGTTIHLIVRHKKNAGSDSTSLGKELMGQLPFWALLAVIIVWILPAIMQGHDGLPVRGYGTMLLCAVTLATLLGIWRGHKIDMSPDQVISLVFWIFVPGILGARIFYITEYWNDLQRDTMWETLGQLVNITSGGLVVYGSVIGGMIGIIGFTAWHRLRFLTVVDMLAPCLMLGIAIGRLGCLMFGCCFGGVCDHTWAVTFPGSPDAAPAYISQYERGTLLGIQFASDPEAPSVLVEVKPDSPAYDAGLRSGDQIIGLNGLMTRNNRELRTVWVSCCSELGKMDSLKIQKKDGTVIVVPLPERSLPVHPTQIYSSLNGFFIFLFLMALSPFLPYEGMMFATVMTIYPITRFLLEIIRTDEAAIFGTGLSISQNVSIVLLLGIAGLWLYILVRRRPVYSCE